MGNLLMKIKCAIVCSLMAVAKADFIDYLSRRLEDEVE